MKNHIAVNGKLLRINKKFTQLKSSQKEKINLWLYEEYSRFWEENSREPGKQQKEIIIGDVYAKIEDAGIWLPVGELYKYYESHITKFRKKYEKTKDSFNNENN